MEFERKRFKVSELLQNWDVGLLIRSGRLTRIKDKP
jgi:hypothetical protein